MRNFVIKARDGEIVVFDTGLSEFSVRIYEASDRVCGHQPTYYVDASREDYRKIRTLIE